MAIKGRRALIGIFLFGLIFISGCGTIKGMVNGAREGIKKDWASAQNWDDWMRKNLW